jgi:hypothetical protein
MLGLRTIVDGTVGAIHGIRIEGEPMAGPEGTIAEVLDWVGDDPARAREALDAEYDGQNRSTLIAQLEAIADAEEAPMSDEPAVEDAPAAEQPAEVELFAEDEGTIVGPVHLRDPDVEVGDVIEANLDDPVAIAGEQVEVVQGASSTNGLALNINGNVFLLNSQMVGALKRVVDQAVAGINF